jgi:hypothetical protein
MKKYSLLIITLAACAAFLILYFLLRDPKQPDSHNYQHDQAQSDLKIVRQQRDSGLKVIDSLHGVIVKRDKEKVELNNKLTTTRHDLDKSVNTAIRLSKEIKLMKDTARMAGWGDDEWAIVRRVTLDSLTGEVGNLAYLYQQYKDFSDSLTVIVSKNEVDYKAALTEQKRLYDNLYSKYEQLYKLYEQLFKDYSSVKKSIKRERLKTKIAALLALVAGGAAVVK